MSNSSSYPYVSAGFPAVFLLPIIRKRKEGLVARKACHSYFTVYETILLKEVFLWIMLLFVNRFWPN